MAELLTQNTYVKYSNVESNKHLTQIPDDVESFPD